MAQAPFFFIFSIKTRPLMPLREWPANVFHLISQKNNVNDVAFDFILWFLNNFITR